MIAMEILGIFSLHFYLKFSLTICLRFPFGTSQQSNTVVMIHDAFQPLSYWTGFMPPPNWQGVIIDTHIYQMFSQSVIHLLQASFENWGLTCLRFSWFHKQTHNTSQPPAASCRICRILLSGPSSGSGPLHLTTARNTSTVVAQEPDTTALSLARLSLEVARDWRDRLPLSARVTRRFWGNIGKPKRRPTRQGIKDGFNGHGRPRMPMNGPTKLVWPMGGYLRTPPATNSPTFVDEMIFKIITQSVLPPLRLSLMTS